MGTSDSSSDFECVFVNLTVRIQRVCLGVEGRCLHVFVPAYRGFRSVYLQSKGGRCVCGVLCMCRKILLG